MRIKPFKSLEKEKTMKKVCSSFNASILMQTSLVVDLCIVK